MRSKHAISSGKWLGLFAASVLLVALLLAAFNVVTDPFGAFGDRFFTWWSYDETNNPRLAKMSYLRQHHDRYDSYIIGCSSTSSFPVEDLNRYYDASFYNLIMYGADMLDVEQMSRYLIEHYTVKNLIVNVYIDNGMNYGDEPQPLGYKMPYWVSGDPAWDFYATYLFANPSYGFDKLRKLRGDGYLQQAHDVFNEDTGAYDKSVRDVEHIGAMDRYLEAYPVFTDYDRSPRELAKTEPCMQSLAAIRDLCAARGVNFLVVAAPVYYDYLTTFPREQAEAFYTSLAAVAPYWDFSVSSVSREPRYFYDGTHFRNAVGTMALARIAGDAEVYVPADFGAYVTPENAAAHVSGFWDVPEPDTAAYAARLPILMYHHVTEDGPAGDAAVTAKTFEAHMRALSEAGYTAVDFSDLRGYVCRGEALPEKPVVITFDDGYKSNMTLALPILERFGMKATVFIIGVSAGKDTYKDTGVAMTEHFSLADAAAMEQSGVFSVQSHGYDIHEVPGRDPEPVREGILQKEGETEAEYISFLRRDCAAMNELLRPLGHGAEVLAYPHGKHSLLSSVLLREAGVYATVTTDAGVNTLVRGLPQCLWDMDRFDISDDLTGAQLLGLIECSPAA